MQEITIKDLNDVCQNSSPELQIMAIQIVIQHLQFMRWSYSKRQLFSQDPRYQLALLTLIEKFGIYHFTEAAKEIFDSNIVSLDIKNLEHGPHTDISPYDSNFALFVKKLIANVHPIANTLDYGYLVNVKPLFADPGFWLFLLEYKSITQDCYESLISHIKQWPSELENQATYNPNKKIKPIVDFAEYFPDAFALLEKDLFFKNKKCDFKPATLNTDLVSLSPGTYKVIFSNYVYIWHVGQAYKFEVEDYLLGDHLHERDNLDKQILDENERNHFESLIASHIEQRQKIKEWLKEYSFEWEQFCISRKSDRKSTHQLEAIAELICKVMGVMPTIAFKKTTLSEDDSNIIESKHTNVLPPAEITFDKNKINLVEIRSKLKLFAITLDIDESSNSITLYSIDIFLKIMEDCLLTGALTPRSELFIDAIINKDPEVILSSIKEDKNVLFSENRFLSLANRENFVTYRFGEMNSHFSLFKMKGKFQNRVNDIYNNQMRNIQIGYILDRIDYDEVDNLNIRDFIDDEIPSLDSIEFKQDRSHQESIMEKALVKNKITKDHKSNSFARYLCHFIKNLPEICLAYPAKQDAILQWLFNNKAVRKQVNNETFFKLLKVCRTARQSIFENLLTPDLFDSIVNDYGFLKLIKEWPSYKSIFLENLMQDDRLARQVLYNHYFVEQLSEYYREENQRRKIIEYYLSGYSIEKKVLAAYPDQHDYIVAHIIQNQTEALLTNESTIRSLKILDANHKVKLFAYLIQNPNLLLSVCTSVEEIVQLFHAVVSKEEDNKQLCQFISTNIKDVSVTYLVDIFPLFDVCYNKEMMLLWVLENIKLCPNSYFITELVESFPEHNEKIFMFLVKNNFLKNCLENCSFFSDVIKFINLFSQKKEEVLSFIFGDKELWMKVVSHAWESFDNFIAMAKLCTTSQLKEKLLLLLSEGNMLIDYRLESSKEFTEALKEQGDELINIILKKRDNKLPKAHELSEILAANTNQQFKIIDWLIDNSDRFQKIMETKGYNYSLYYIINNLIDNQNKTRVVDYIIKHNFAFALLFDAASMPSYINHLPISEQEKISSLLLSDSALRTKVFTAPAILKTVLTVFPQYFQIITSTIVNDESLRRKLFQYVSDFIRFFDKKTLELENYYTFFKTMKDALLKDEECIQHFIENDRYIYFEQFLAILGNDVEKWLGIAFSQSKVKVKLFSAPHCIQVLAKQAPHCQKAILDAIFSDKELINAFFNLKCFDILKEFLPEARKTIFHYLHSNENFMYNTFLNTNHFKSLVKNFPAYAVEIIPLLLKQEEFARKFLTNIDFLILVSEINELSISEIISKKIFELNIQIINSINKNFTLCFIAKQYPILQDHLLQSLVKSPSIRNLLFCKSNDIKNANEVFSKQDFLQFLSSSRCYINCIQTVDDVINIISLFPSLEDTLITEIIKPEKLSSLLNDGYEAARLIQSISRNSKERVVKFLLENENLLARCCQHFEMLMQFVVASKASAQLVLIALARNYSLLRTCFGNISNIDLFINNFSLDPSVKSQILQQLIGVQKAAIEFNDEESKSLFPKF